MLRVVLLVFVAACSNGSDTVEQEVPPPVAGVASVALMLDVEAIDPASDLGDPLVTGAQITLSTVELVYDDGSRHLIADTSRTLNLLTPTNTITLGVADVPAGTITAVDVLVDSASVTRDGEVLSVSGVGSTSIAVPSVTVEVDCTRVVTASFDPNSSFDFIPPDDPDPVPGRCDRVFDFEGLPSGTKLRNQLAPAVTVSCDNARSAGPDECIVFDTDNITGGDDDLTGGNGNVVIIAENVTDGDGDGLVDDPDDDAAGGVQTYTFDPAIDLDSVFVVDIDLNEDNGKLVITREDGTVTERELPPIGNASIQTIDVREENVVKLEVHLPSSGGIDDIAYHVDCDEPGEPGPGSFAFDPMFEFVDSELMCDEMPPDPGLMAPPLNPYILTPFNDQVSFLYTGPDAIQTGVDANAIDDARVTVLRGAVLDGSGAPLPAVTITSLDPGFGQTMTRIDGRYDFALNGGGAVTLEFRADGFVPVQRTVQTQWNEYVVVPDVVLTPLDQNATTVAFPPASSTIARGSTVSDNDGPRTATLIFEPGTLATLEFTDGSTAPADSLDIRLTEFTVGERGQQAMPALLPPTSGYTYAVELSADEAGANVERISFSEPVPFYVDNFIGFPVGTDVPSGFYDRQTAKWVPINDGRVIAIVGVSGGLADIDLDGDGVVDDPSGIGVTSDERAQLAATYAVGAELWRVALPHFTPFDLNFPNQLPGAPPEGPVLDGTAVDDPCTSVGSLIECENQVLRETIRVPGTPQELVYSSANAPGDRSENTIRAQLTGSVVDPLLQRVEVVVEVAGRTFETSFAPAPNIDFEFEWDGADAYGRGLVGAATYQVTIRHLYPILFQEPAPGLETSFAALGVTNSGWDFCRLRAPGECILGAQQTTFNGFLGRLRRGQAIGGWALSTQHAYDVNSGLLVGGDGQRRNGPGAGIRTVAGGGADNAPGDGDLATTLHIDVPETAIAGAPDGTTYLYGVTPTTRLIQVQRTGTIRTFPIDPDVGAGFTVLPNQSSLQLTVTDRGEVFYVVEVFDLSTFALLPLLVQHDPFGPDTIVAGLGAVYDPDGDFEGPAADLRFTPLTGFDPGEISAIAADTSGSLYLASFAGLEAYLVRRISPAGLASRVAGIGTPGNTGDGGPASQAGIDVVTDIAVHPGGALYLLDEFPFTDIRRIGTDGIIETLNGATFIDDNLKGELLSDVAVNARSIAIDSGGTLYFSRAVDERIYRVGTDGVLEHIAGSGETGTYRDGQLPLNAPLFRNSPLESNPLGGLLFMDTAFDTLNRIARIEPDAGRAPDGSLFVPNRDETELYEFANDGRHLRTHDPLTGAVMSEFGYDTEGRVTSATDAHGNVTTILRDPAGTATSIIGPYGHITTLTYDPNGFLAAVTDDESQTTNIETRPDGLLDAFIDPRGGRYEMTWDGLGRLLQNDDPAGGSTSLLRTDTNDGWFVEKTTGESRTTTHSVGRDLGNEDRTTALPDGTVITSTEDASGLQVIDYPDGRTVTRTEVASPRFGAQGEFLSGFSIALPSGLTSTTSIEQTVDANPADPLDLTQLITTTDVNGRVFTEAFSRSSLTRTSITPEGRTSTTTFDANGRVVETQLPGRLPTQMTYDANGRLAESSQGTRTWTYAYDARSNLDSVTNPLTETTLFDHDLVGRLTSETSPLGNETTFGYDEAGNMTSLTPPGQPAHTFSYTPVDLESQYTPPVLPEVSMPQTTYDYSLDRELELETRPDGRVIDWQHDSAGRLSKLAFPAETRDYSYDATTGQLTGITSTSGEGLAFEYDGDLVTKTTWSGTVNASVEKEYDENFWVVRETVNGAWPVDYVYDDDGLLVQAGEMTITRDPVTGFVVATELDNITTQTTYNAYGERETYTAWFQSTMLYWEEHERDDLGRITQTTEIVEGVQKIWEYAYDLDGRLAEAYVDGDLRYSYTSDANGNRTQFEDPVAGILTTADYDDQDRLLRYGDTTYTYTDNGELASETSPIGLTSYDYDVFANLRSLTLPDGTTVDYAIDPRDRRIATFIEGAFDDGFVYRDQLEPIARMDPAGIEQRYVYGTFEHVPDLYTDGTTKFAYLSDIRGSVRLIVDSGSGLVAGRIDYSPFGIASTTTTVQPFGFNGGIVGPRGLVRFGARIYEPVAGRWHSKDAQRFALRGNHYEFTIGDPVNAIDRTGFGPVPPGNAPQPPVKPPSPPPKNACEVYTEECEVEREDYGKRLVRCIPRCYFCPSPSPWADDPETGCPSSVTVVCERDDPVIHSGESNE